MEITRKVAFLLKQLLQGEVIPASRLSSRLFQEMIEEGVLQQKFLSRTRCVVCASRPEELQHYLTNRYAITDIDSYIATCDSGLSSRADNILLTGSSKATVQRTFKGFMINVLSPIACRLHDTELIVRPNPGTFTFIYDYESFVIPKDVTVVGVENPENFRYVERQMRLFKHITPLFISRYPQSQYGDVKKWLTRIPNCYLHFGDFDFWGIRIYQTEFKCWLKERAEFFVPSEVFRLLPLYGNKQLYNEQLKVSRELASVEERDLKCLLEELHRYHSCLEQEVLEKKSFT